MKGKTIFKYLEVIPLKLMSHIPHGQRIMRHYLLQQIKEYEKSCDYYCSVYIRPKNASQVVSIEKETTARKKTAIVMQGPLISEDDFTVETVKIYEKIYPGAIVIISTWEGQDIQIIERLERLGNCEVILNVKPEHSGMLNLNFQVASTMAGIRRAKELGKEYVFKTRCDYRFLRLGLIDYFISLCRTFPVEPPDIHQKSRIILGTDVLSSCYRAFWVTDRFNFGYIDDMMLYWDYEVNEIDISKNAVQLELKKNPRTWREVTESGLCAEPRLLRNYIKRIQGIEPECSIKNYWDVLKQRFIMVSYEETGAYWQKYDGRRDESERLGIYYKDRDDNSKCLCYNWSFARWLSLYMGTMEYRPEYELFQQKNIGF